MEMVKPGAVKPAASIRLTRDDWADAALGAISRNGLEGVAVEPLAAALGVTKGSFYWHFANRSELLQAALDRWEQVSTIDIIAILDTIDDPEVRLRTLLQRVLDRANDDRNENAIFGAVDDPFVMQVVNRVNAARQEFLRRIFSQLGFRPAGAQMRARIAYATYLGHVTLQVTEQQKQRSSPTYIDELVATLTAR